MVESVNLQMARNAGYDRAGANQIGLLEGRAERPVVEIKVLAGLEQILNIRELGACDLANWYDPVLGEDALVGQPA